MSQIDTLQNRVDQLTQQVSDLRGFQQQAIQALEGIDQQIVTDVSNALTNVNTELQQIVTQIQTDEAAINNLSQVVQNLQQAVQALLTWAATVPLPSPGP